MKLGLGLAKYAASLFLLTSSITFFRKMIVLLVLLNSRFNYRFDVESMLIDSIETICLYSSIELSSSKSFLNSLWGTFIRFYRCSHLVASIKNTFTNSICNIVIYCLIDFLPLISSSSFWHKDSRLAVSFHRAFIDIASPSEVAASRLASANSLVSPLFDVS